MNGRTFCPCSQQRVFPRTTTTTPTLTTTTGCHLCSGGYPPCCYFANRGRSFFLHQRPPVYPSHISDASGFYSDSLITLPPPPRPPPTIIQDTSLSSSPTSPKPIPKSPPCPDLPRSGEQGITMLSPTRLAQILETPKLNKDPNSLDHQLLQKAILDCYARFLLNLPHSLLKDHVHLHFQVQEAHWWYEDFWYDTHPEGLPKMSLKSFGLILWETFPLLQEFISEHQKGRLMRDWVDYCRTIPLRGAIILNKSLTKCLLVQGWQGGRWTFPRGKIDEQESDTVCAAREVLEEIGVDITELIHPDMFIERTVGKQTVKLFVVPGVDENGEFGPQKRKEIAEIRWVNLSSLGSLIKRQAKKSPKKLGSSTVFGGSQPSVTLSGRVKFTHVAPFVRGIQAWIRILQTRQRRQESVSPKDLLQGFSVETLRSIQYPEAYGAAPKTTLPARRHHLDPLALPESDTDNHDDNTLSPRCRPEDTYEKRKTFKTYGNPDCSGKPKICEKSDSNGKSESFGVLSKTNGALSLATKPSGSVLDLSSTDQQGKTQEQTERELLRRLLEVVEEQNILDHSEDRVGEERTKVDQPTSQQPQPTSQQPQAMLKKRETAVSENRVPGEKTFPVAPTMWQKGSINSRQNSVYRNVATETNMGLQQAPSRKKRLWKNVPSSQINKRIDEGEVEFAKHHNSMPTSARKVPVCMGDKGPSPQQITSSVPSSVAQTMKVPRVILKRGEKP